MASFTINDTLHQKQFFSITLCKYPSTLNTFKFHYSSHVHTFSPPKHTLQPKISPLFVVRAHVRRINAKLSTTDHELSTKTSNLRTSKETASGVSPLRSGDERVDRKSQKTYFSSMVEEEIDKSFTKDRYTKKRVGSRNRREMGSGVSSMRSKDERLGIKSMKIKDSLEVKEKMDKIFKKGDDNQVGEGKMGKGSKKSKVDMPGAKLKIELDMCSKRGDVMGAIALYDSRRREGIKMGQYYYTVLLYLCSSAAVGVVRPAKSGSDSRNLNSLNMSNEVSGGSSVDVGEFGEMGKGNFDSTQTKISFSNNGLLVKSGKSRGNSDKMELNSDRFPLEVAKDDVDSNFNEKKNLTQFSNGFMKPSTRFLDRLVHSSKDDDDSANIKDGNSDQEDNEIWVSEDVKKYALQRGFEIYEKMSTEKVPMNEATLTSVARMAMSMRNGDMAFDMVKQMIPLGINPRLRSYGPALSTYCTSGDVDKAFAVEEHMLKHGVYPEEPELEALLRLSIGAGKSDKVYYLLHKLRTSVRKVSPSTADLIEKWFKSKAASRVGKRKWDKKLIMEAMENGGGGWHGQGWLGRGQWTVSCTTVGDDGLCKCCGEKLATIDLDPIETENFAESVASIATKREKNSSFQKFQKWLDYYGPFEAVVDAANVGLFSQKRFIPSKINAVVNGIRQMLPSKKWPLIVLHNKRITGHKMDEPINKALIEKWKNADALYATPTGSNDDWYWLYAAIKFKCLLVTNDEMRDHIFQLLGNDFFPKWKERHQVHFSFSDSGPVFHMPPPCSVVIQESKKGHWHIPVVSERDYEGERTWLCVTRANSHMARQDSATVPEELLFCHHEKGRSSSDTQTELQIKPPPPSPPHNENCENTKKPPQEIFKSLRDILSESVFSSHGTILSEIEAAEKLGSCIIDFQI